MAVAQVTGPRLPREGRRPPSRGQRQQCLGPNQCAQRKQEGHWKRQCPMNPAVNPMTQPSVPPEPVTVAQLYQERWGPASPSLAAPLVKVSLGEWKVKCLVVTGATFSVLNQTLCPISHNYVQVVWAMGKTKKVYFLRPLKFTLSKKMGIL